MIGVGLIDPKEREKAEIKAIEAKVALPAGMKFERYEGLITSMVRAGLPFEKIFQVIQSVGNATNPENSNAFFDNNIMLAGAEAAATATTGVAAGSLLRENFIDAMFDSAVDAFSHQFGFRNNPYNRKIIRETMISTKTAMQGMFTNPAHEQSVAELIVAGSAGVAKGSIDKFKEFTKKMIDAFKKRLTQGERDHLGDLANKHDVPGLTGFLKEHDKGDHPLAIGSPDDIVHAWNNHFDPTHRGFERLNHQQPGDPNAQQPPLPRQGTHPGNYHHALAAPDHSSSAQRSLTTAANNVGTAAAALNKPASKYATLPHAPGGMNA